MEAGIQRMDRRTAERLHNEAKSLKERGWKVADRRGEDEFVVPPGVGPLDIRVLPVTIYEHRWGWYSPRNNNEVVVNVGMLYRPQNFVLPRGEDPPIPPEEALRHHNGEEVGVFRATWSTTLDRWGVVIKTKLVVREDTIEKRLVAYLSPMQANFIVSPPDSWRGPVVRTKRSFNGTYLLDKEEAIYVLQALGSPLVKNVVEYMELHKAAEKLAR